MIFFNLFSLYSDDANFRDFGFELLKAIELVYMSPKLHELIQIFKIILVS